jgi:hypothetical protein
MQNRSILLFKKKVLLVIKQKIPKMNSVLKLQNLTNKLGKFINFRSSFHNSAKLNNTKYYPINDDVFGLNDDQKEVKFIYYDT